MKFWAVHDGPRKNQAKRTTPLDENVEKCLQPGHGRPGWVRKEESVFLGQPLLKVVPEILILVLNIFETNLTVRVCNGPIEETRVVQRELLLPRGQKRENFGGKVTPVQDPE